MYREKKINLTVTYLKVKKEETLNTAIWYIHKPGNTFTYSKEAK